MPKYLKAVSIALLVVLAVALLSACAPAATSDEQPTAETSQDQVVTITYWHGWTVEHEKQAMEDAVKLFNDSHPNIQVEAIAGKTNDQVLTAVSGGNPPDVWSLWSTQTLAEWASKGVILDLTDRVMEDKIDPNLFYQGALDVSMYQGKYYGLPLEVDPMVVYYNKALFAEAGLDPETPPATIEEMYDYADKLTKLDDNGNITQLGYQGIAMYEVYSFGGNWWDPNTGLPTANDPGNVASWSLMQSYFQKYGAEKISTFSSQQADNPLGSLFMAGQVGMAVDGDWMVSFMSRFAPDMEYGIFAIPPAEGHADRANSTYLDGSIYVIPSNAEHADEAWEFVSWMATHAEASGMLQKAWANTSPLKAVVTDSQYAPSERWTTFTNLMENGQHFIWPPIAASALYYNEMVTAGDAIRFGEKTPQQALDDLQSKITEELQAAQ